MKAGKILKVLSAVAVLSALLYLALSAQDFGPGSDRAFAAATGTDPDDSGNGESEGIRTSARSDLELVAFKEKLLRNLDRIANFDKSLTDEELHKYENELIMAALNDPRARQIMVDELNTAFSTEKRSNIYFLDRVLGVPEPGRKALVENYTKMVIDQRSDDFYALQGVQNHGSGNIPEKDMGVLFDRALAQLDKYDNFARYSPAMNFATTAMSDSSFKATAEQRRALRSKIEMRQASARARHEFFFSAQSLISMSDVAERSSVAERMIAKYPHRGTFDAVIESIELGEFEPSQQLMSTLESVANRLAAERKP